MSNPIPEKQFFHLNINQYVNLPNRERNILITSVETESRFNNYVFAHNHAFIKPDIGVGLPIRRDGCIIKTDRLSEDEMDINFLDLTNLVRAHD